MEMLYEKTLKQENYITAGFFVKPLNTDSLNRIFARQPFNRPNRPLVTLCLSEIANRVARRLFYILTSLVVAAGEAKSPSKRIG